MYSSLFGYPYIYKGGLWKNKWDKVCCYWELGEQIENKIHYRWALGGNMEKPCGTHLGRQN
jgi:hypothetical protein